MTEKNLKRTEDEESGLDGETEDGFDEGFDFAAAKSDGGVFIGRAKMALINKLLANVKENNEKLIRLLSGAVSPEEEARISIGQTGGGELNIDEIAPDSEAAGRIIEGVFDGENMIGPDGKQYSVPPNYASKSKLVEGDILKLTITPNGTFVYKQIGPIERSRLIGYLEQDGDGGFSAVTNNRRLRILAASVTYFKGRAGDEVVVLVPKTGESRWAAVENIVKKV